MTNIFKISGHFADYSISRDERTQHLERSWDFELVVQVSMLDHSAFYVCRVRRMCKRSLSAHSQLKYPKKIMPALFYSRLADIFLPMKSSNGSSFVFESLGIECVRGVYAVNSEVVMYT